MPDALWEFKLLDQQTAYLKTGSFVTSKMQMNWKSFLKESFRQISDKQAKYLIIDIRDNEGGDDEVSLELARYLAHKPSIFSSIQAIIGV
jgi:C-terminal processing protease CtpA/Prc